MSHVVFGVAGGVAAFKAAAAVSKLAQRGVDVRVVMTQAATQFVGPATMSALSGHPVALKLFDPAYPLGGHIALAEGAGLLCVAPATASFLAKAAAGLSDDLLSTLYLACTAPVLMAPAMNSAMWNHPAVQRNVQVLRGDGVQFVEPGSGWLSCRQPGTGRMAEPEVLVEEVCKRLASP